MKRIACMAAAGWLIGVQAAVAEGAVDFDEQIRPIFAANCYECHGPQRQRGDLRLDRRDDILAIDFVVVPGDAEDSEMHFRITLPDDDPDRMPPDGDRLSEEEVALIRDWIDLGADFGDWTEDPEAMRMVEGEDPLPQVAPADEEALAMLRELGALAMPLAQNTNLIAVDFRTEAENIGDSHLDYLKPLAEQVAWLNLARTQVTDEGLSRLSGLKHLRRLHLENTGIGDAGVEHLGGFEDLEYLNLYGTRVGDLGLITVARLDNLQKLFLWQTEVSAAGARALSRALPNAEINLGWEAAGDEVAEAAADEPAVAEAEQRGDPINEACPFSGEPINAAQTVVFAGQTIGFCCGDCKARFEGDPERFIDQVAEFDAEKLAEAEEPGDPINEACPFSDEPIDAAQTVVFAGQTIGFCCGNCKSRFEGDPEQFIDQVAEFEQPDAD